MGDWDSYNDYLDSLPEYHYSVHHKGYYYCGDTDGWNEVGYYTWDEAVKELVSLSSIGFEDSDIYLTDNYPEGITVCIENGELSYV